MEKFGPALHIQYDQILYINGINTGVTVCKNFINIELKSTILFNSIEYLKNVRADM